MSTNIIGELLQKLGFRTEQAGDEGFFIKYRNYNILCHNLNDEGDEVQIVVPGVAEVTPEKRQAVYESIADLMCTSKYVQAFIPYDDNVFIEYRHFLGTTEQPTEELLEHMIYAVSAATRTFHKILKEKLNENDDDNE